MNNENQRVRILDNKHSIISLAILYIEIHTLH